MPRVPYVSREDLPEEQREIYDRITGPPRNSSRPLGYNLLLNAPELALRVSEVGMYARFRTAILADIRELAILTTAQEMGNQYHFSHHVPLARKAGVRDGVIEAIKRRTSQGLLPEEAAIIEYARQVVHRRVNDAAFSAVERALGRKGAVELTMVIGYFVMIGHAMMALGVELEPSMERALPET